MHIVKQRVRPRCADCGSANVILEGTATWDKSKQIWCVIQPCLHETPTGLFAEGARTGTGFHCRDCMDNVGIRFAKS